MLTEKEVIKRLEMGSGLSFSKKDFGFISGTSSPFMGDKLDHKATSRVSGYKVWRKDGKGIKEFNLSSPLEFNLEFVIAFLTMKDDEFNKFLVLRGYFII